jgi:hypothetical protein
VPTRGRASSSSPTAGLSSPSEATAAWLDKGAASVDARDLLLASVADRRFRGYIDAADGDWMGATGRAAAAHVWEERLDIAVGAPADGVERSLEHLFQHRRWSRPAVVFVPDFSSADWRDRLTAVEHPGRHGRDQTRTGSRAPRRERDRRRADARTGRVTHVRLTKKRLRGAGA